MRLIELNFAALGPFAGEQRIRFADFEPAGLFLLRGATGSGKSSIIDAVLFALYGESPLKDTSSAQRLRSNFADNATASYAELLFEVPSGAYLVRRSPRYVKPGNKHATPGTAVLEKVQLVDDQIVGREPLAAKPADVNAVIPQILGIQHSQFLQTVVLPQGKFAEFVRATPDSRKQLLQQIFKTQQFDRFTEALKERAKAAKSEYDGLVAEAKFLASSITKADASGLEVSELLDTAAATVAAESQLASQRTQAAAQAEAAVNEAALLVQETGHLQQLLEEFREVAAQKETLEQQGESIAQLRQQVQLAQAAQELVAAHQQQQELAQKLSAAQAKIEADFQVQADDAEVFSHAQQRETELSQQLKDAETRLAQLETFAQKETQLATYQAQASELEALITDAEKLVADAKDPLAVLAGRIESLRAAETEKPQLIERISLITERLEHSRTGDLKRAELVACAEEIGVAKRQHSQAVRDYERAWQVWQADAARQLAADLEPGQACLVCGSTTHPAPADGKAEADGRAEAGASATASASASASDSAEAGETNPASSLASCTQAVNAASVELEVKKQLQADLTAEIVRLKELAGTHTAQLEDWLSEAKAELAQVDAQLAEAAALNQQLTAAKETLSAIESKLLTDRVRQEETQKLLVLLETELTQLRQQTALENLPAAELAQDLRLQVATLETQLATQKQLLNELSHLTSLQQLTAGATQTAAQLLCESDFASFSEAVAAAAAVPSLTAALQEIADFTAQTKQVETAFTKLAGPASQVGNLPHLGSLKTTLGKLSAQQVAARTEAIQAATNLANQQQRFTQLAQQLELLTQQEATSGYLRRLAELAGGAKTASGTAIPLSTWVLIERFEAVIAAANPFIARFSNGRFKLLRVDEDGNSTAQHGGLGISVYDNETDQQRPSKTLSGGETFYVSLALALGLAEVVSAEAGGIDFKSMLIDEGFGTLDPETLDKVLEGIKQINHSGRTVGIVSHVEELRRRISDGIEVVASPQGGSRLRIYS